METNRRNFIKTASAAGLILPFTSCSDLGAKTGEFEEEKLTEICNKPVLNVTSLNQPVIIESMELLRLNDTYFVRTRSKDGAEGISVTNKKIDVLYPILLKLIIPFFIGKDARQIETLLDELYVSNSNYKMQGLALWCCVAWAEGSIIDLLGKTAGKHISYFFGNRVREAVPIYVASGNRGTTPVEEIDILQQKIAETGAKAVKFKVGGRMSRNKDSMPGRSENLIELSRKILGDDITIQADANGSYGVKKAIEIGRRLEAINAYLFEEPCRFDNTDETKQVADALKIPISGGEQESSEYRFRKMIADNVLQIVQPDLHYYGGFIRTTRVARMAEATGKPITIHISNRNAGYAEMVNFSSFTPNIGRFQELKTGMEATADLFEPVIQVKNGLLNVPTAPGLGMAHAEYALKKAVPIKS
ncbi:mandelate racemase/muconate lactonizing enzyme family protein [Saccharicrinis sp. FJH62]|uniref:mandelate racemase/muconate lactonizing enzyme family protein n=1 Tax=Saccharicrinis sp. FJH62 TaxID=3344657 RepID=UPI0035D4F724